MMSKIELIAGDKLIKVKFDTFPGGEEYVCILEPKKMDQPLTIFANLNDSGGIMRLMLLVNAIRVVNPIIPIQVVMPYFPYARQDRVCKSGESLSAKVMAQLINSMDIQRVEIWDAHSDVSTALLDKCSHANVVDVISNFAANNENFAAALVDCIFVAPDAGAAKKVAAVAAKFKRPMIQCNKVRDADGAIKYLEMQGFGLDMSGANMLIVDDICDGGATFTSLAGMLQGHTSGEISLYITHGIFSKGYDPLYKAGISNVFAANNMLEGCAFTDRQAPLAPKNVLSEPVAHPAELATQG